MRAPRCTAELQCSARPVKGACLQRTFRTRRTLAAGLRKQPPSNSRCGPSKLQVCRANSVHHPSQEAGSRTPAAKAAIFTGTYATIAGLALVISPVTVFGLLFDASAVPRGWIRVGGILFALIGMQYLGAGLRDGRVPPPAPQREVQVCRDVPLPAQISLLLSHCEQESLRSSASGSKSKQDPPKGSGAQ